MITVDQLEVNGQKVIGLKVDLPQAPLILLKSNQLLIGCGYFDIEAMEQLDQPACIVGGVESFEDVLCAEIKQLTTGAANRGARKGMVVRDFLKDL